MFSDIVQMEALRQGVDGIDEPFIYMPTSSPGWINDINAHITPVKTAGAPDVPATFATYWNAQSNAYCSVGGTVSGNCAPASGKSGLSA
mmetsp:Transcript_32971/g.27918  ORF Transcript_32971/g.27918 Transcript_32971/m.27918 type:complete len:89 (+) Transcript_32971:3-269(+)